MDILHSCFVNYRGFDILYSTLDTHKDHPPTAQTLKGKIWEKKLFYIYRDLLQPDDIALDCGAYIGTHALPMSKFCKEVHAFEMVEDIFNVLKLNKEENDCDNLFLYNVALSQNERNEWIAERQTGTSKILTEAQASRAMNDSSNKLGKLKSKKTKSLDQIFPEKTGIKLLKIDVEGNEFALLYGAEKLIERNRPHILIEVWRHKRETLKQWALRNKYKMEWLRGDDFYLEPLP